jgi:hypothetical protein
MNVLKYTACVNFLLTIFLFYKKMLIDINFFVLVTGTVASSVNLPSYINGQQIIIRNSKTASVGVTINPVSGQNILNLVTITSYTLVQAASVTLYCDGTRWIIMRN